MAETYDIILTGEQKDKSISILTASMGKKKVGGRRQREKKVTQVRRAGPPWARCYANHLLQISSTNLPNSVDTKCHYTYSTDEESKAQRFKKKKKKMLQPLC